LYVVTAPTVAANTPFTFVVPGQYTYNLIAVRATLTRGVGGLPNRSLQLAITDGTTTVAVSPATDVGTEPGTLTVTWAACSPAAVAAGPLGVSVGPLPLVTIPAGYNVIGSVVNGVVADQWTNAVVWYRYGP
jgi:hypothetical protein